jgi:malate dehydrogenase (oxaloacetate-decarboxylating)(NADP+)
MIIRKEDALRYHADGKAGKVEIAATKPLVTLRDLALAYSPGVAYPCLEIAQDVNKVYDYTARGNMVAVISNGTAVLGLGNIGPEAAKPVMEGKAILFKKYADIDGIDIEVNAHTVEDFVRVVKALEPTFGAVNLEDIKAPECFAIETILRREMKIPVMHDDQHGTAIISSAALINALQVAGKKIKDVRMLINGAGASATSCARMYLDLGLQKKNLLMFDSKGLIHKGRTDLDEQKVQFAADAETVKTLAEAFKGIDVFVGLSKGNLVTADMVRSMAHNPIVFALANPDPEIKYEEATAARPDVIMATGRSDYPNQVNNALGYPYIFRGALDVRATEINDAMKLAAAHAIAKLAHEPVPETINQIYSGQRLNFGRDYLIPKPMDSRLLVEVSSAVAKAAIETGVAQHKVTDWQAYREQLIHRGGPNTAFMRSVMLKAQKAPQRVVFPEAEQYKVLKAAQILVDEKLAHPVLLGNRALIEQRMKEYEIEIPDLEIVDIDADPQLLSEFTQKYYEAHMRKGVTFVESKRLVMKRNYFGMMMVREGMADALVTGLIRNYTYYIRPVIDIIGLEPHTKTACGLYILRSKKDLYFFADTTINKEPTEDQLVDIVQLTMRAVNYFGVTPRIAMLSYANFGGNRDGLNARMAGATRRLRSLHPEVVIDGEVQANFAMRPDLVKEFFPFSAFSKGPANTFIFPNLAAANIAYKLVQEIGEVESAGPILLGLQKPVYVMQMGSSVREIVNLAAVAVLDAASRK